MRIQKATGLATCKYCHTIIAKGDMEIVGNIGSGKFERHHHLRRTKLDQPHPDLRQHCDGFIRRAFETFIDPLVSSLTEEELGQLGLEVKGN